MYTLIGIAVGMLLNYLIVKPIQRKRIRDECIRDGLAPQKNGA